MKIKENPKLNKKYQGYYIDYRIIEHEGQAGMARVGITYTYKYYGNIPINGKHTYNEQETNIRFLSWLEKFKKMIKTKKYTLPVDYNDLQINEKRAVRLQYIKEQSNLCIHCDMPLNELPAYGIQKADINWEIFPKNFQKHPVHLHHNHETGMTIGAVHMKCNAYLWQYKGE